MATATVLTATDGPCILRELPPPFLMAARDIALRERPENQAGVPVASRLGVQVHKQWERGRRIGVALNNPSPQQRRFVFDILAASWAAHCSISFAEVPWAKAELRFTLDPAGGNVSYIGTDALMLLGQPSGNLGQLTAGIVIHEFGHALGFPHNMALPNYGLTPDYGYLIPWARQTQGWDEATLRAQYEKMPPEHLRYSVENDLKSVMQYWQEAAWNLQRVTVPPNETLSAGDIAFVGREDVYDKPTADPVKPPTGKPPRPTEVIKRLKWDEATVLPCHPGGVTRIVLPTVKATPVTIWVKETADGVPLLDLGSAGNRATRLPSVTGAKNEVTRFKARLAGRGDYDVLVQWRGAPPSEFTIIAEPK